MTKKKQGEVFPEMARVFGPFFIYRLFWSYYWNQ